MIQLPDTKIFIGKMILLRQTSKIGLLYMLHNQSIIKSLVGTGQQISPTKIILTISFMKKIIGFR